MNPFAKGLSTQRSHHFDKRPAKLRSRDRHSSCIHAGDRFTGFTLVELLVALAILALLSVLGYRALSALIDSETRLAEEAARWRTLDQFFTRLESDMREAQPRIVRAPTANEPALLGVTDVDGNANVGFSRAGAEFSLEAGSAGQRMSYRFREGKVEVVYFPFLDIGPTTPSTSYVLADNVSRFRIWYLDPAGDWRDRWPLRNDASLPRAVRVELQLAGGETIERWLALR